MIYKLQLNVYKAGESEENEDTIWIDFYLDVTTIMAFRVGESEYTDTKDKGTFIYVRGETFLVKNEPHIIEYLLERFVNKAIEK